MIDHVSIVVADLAASHQFYHEILGLPQIERPNLAFDGAWYGLGNGVSLHLLRLNSVEAGLQRPEHVGRDRHIALTVTSLTDYIGRLQQYGYSFSRSKSGRDAIFSRDPDGNGVELIAQ